MIEILEAITYAILHNNVESIGHIIWQLSRESES